MAKKARKRSKAKSAKRARSKRVRTKSARPARKRGRSRTKRPAKRGNAFQIMIDTINQTERLREKRELRGSDETE